MHKLLLLTLISLCQLGISQELSDNAFTKVVFEDDFSKSEFKKGWKFGSAEPKLENEMLRTKAKPGHGANHGHETTPFTDSAVSFRFKMNEEIGKNDIVIKVNFNDNKFKEVHAGHVCRVMIQKNKVTFSDDKFGTFRKDISLLRKAGKLDKKISNELKKTTTKVFKHEYKLDKGWHDVLVITEGDVMQISINNKIIGSYKTAGNAHPTKRHFAIGTGYRDIYLDDVKFRLKN